VGLDRELDARFEVAGDHQERHLPRRRGQGVELLHVVEAVAVVLDHLLQAPRLPFDPPQPPLQLVLLVPLPVEVEASLVGLERIAQRYYPLVLAPGLQGG
jgi:hypothetical protein